MIQTVDSTAIKLDESGKGVVAGALTVRAQVYQEATSLRWTLKIMLSCLSAIDQRLDADYERVLAAVDRSKSAVALSTKLPREPNVRIDPIRPGSGLAESRAAVGE